MTTNRIDVTKVDLTTLIKSAYALSSPQGMGHLHARPGELDDKTVNELVERYKDDKHQAVSMDYVHGRSIKMHVDRVGDKLYIDDTWYDHTPEQLEHLMTICGVDWKAPKGDEVENG